MMRYFLLLLIVFQEDGFRKQSILCLLFALSFSLKRHSKVLGWKVRCCFKIWFLIVEYSNYLFVSFFHDKLMLQMVWFFIFLCFYSRFDFIYYYRTPSLSYLHLIQAHHHCKLMSRPFQQFGSRQSLQKTSLMKNIMTPTISQQLVILAFTSHLLIWNGC